MNITEIRVKMVSDSTERLRAFCSLTLDGDFVVRDLKVIEGTNGPFVAMPSRKLSDRCSKCGNKNHLRARHCNECGSRLNENRAPRDPQGRVKLHADVAHPINAACREHVQNAVVEAYQRELEQSKQPGYKPTALDEEEPEVAASDYDELVSELKEKAATRVAERGAGRSFSEGGSRDFPKQEETHDPDEEEASVAEPAGSSPSEPQKDAIEPSEQAAPSDDDGFGVGIL